MQLGGTCMHAAQQLRLLVLDEAARPLQADSGRALRRISVAAPQLQHHLHEALRPLAARLWPQPHGHLGRARRSGCDAQLVFFDSVHGLQQLELGGQRIVLRLHIGSCRRPCRRESASDAGGRKGGTVRGETPLPAVRVQFIYAFYPESIRNEHVSTRSVMRVACGMRRREHIAPFRASASTRKACGTFGAAMGPDRAEPILCGSGWSAGSSRRSRQTGRGRESARWRPAWPLLRTRSPRNQNM